MIVTLLSRVSSSSPCPLLCTLYQRLSRVSLTYTLASVSLFSQLSSLISPFLSSLCSLFLLLVSLHAWSVAIFLCLIEIRQRCVYDIRLHAQRVSESIDVHIYTWVLFTISSTYISKD